MWPWRPSFTAQQLVGEWAIKEATAAQMHMLAKDEDNVNDVSVSMGALHLLLKRLETDFGVDSRNECLNTIMSV